jgi:hypothetical protein
MYLGVIPGIILSSCKCHSRAGYRLLLISDVSRSPHLTRLYHNLHSDYVCKIIVSHGIIFIESLAIQVFTLAAHETTVAIFVNTVDICACSSNGKIAIKQREDRDQATGRSRSADQDPVLQELTMAPCDSWREHQGCDSAPASTPERPFVPTRNPAKIRDTRIH